MTGNREEYPDEVRQEVKSRLLNGESPEDLADEDDLPSRRLIYKIKSEMEEDQQLQQALEEDVFRSTHDADRDDIVEVLDQANVGIKQDGEPKAKMQKALNAIDFDDAWDDPHAVADELVEEANMTREWANRVVRKAYDMPDFPYVDRAGRDRDEQSAGRRRRPPRRDDRDSPDRDRRRGRRTEDAQHGDGRGETTQDAQLRRQMQQLQSTVSQLAETVSEAVTEDDDSGSDTVVVEQGDKTLEVPYHVAAAQGLLDNGTDDEKDFMEKLREAKEAGIIPDPEDFQQDDDGDDLTDVVTKLKELGVIDDGGDDEQAERLGEMMEQVSEQMAQAQENVATQMSAAISQLADEDDDDDDLTLEDVREVIEEREREDRIDHLADELNQTREELRDELQSSRRRTSSPDNDPEVVKQRDEHEHEREQLRMVNETLQQLPDRLTGAVQDGLLPLYERMQLQQDAGQSQMWSPPSAETQSQPSYTPAQPPEGDSAPRGSRQDTPQQQPAQPAAAQQPAEDSAGGDTAGMVEERAAEVRDSLGLDTDAAESEGEA